MSNFKLSDAGVDFIYAHECKGKMPKTFKAYPDQGGVWTIGIGNTFYADGRKVAKGDVITQQEAKTLFLTMISRIEKDVNKLVKSKINQSQFDALVSFVYNLGAGDLARSSLLRIININPNNPGIRREFGRWNKVRINGVLTVSAGLAQRRADEADLYFQQQKEPEKIIYKCSKKTGICTRIQVRPANRKIGV